MGTEPFDVLTQAAIVVMPYRELVEFWNHTCEQYEGDPGNEELQIVFEFVKEELHRRPEFHGEAPVGYEAICGLCWETFNPNGPDDLIHTKNVEGVWCGGVGVMLGSWR